MAATRKSPSKPAPGARGSLPNTTKTHRELEELIRIGIALSETRDVDQLLDLILKKAREITSADAGSLYLVDKGGVQSDGGLRPTQLRFKLIQNDSVQFPFSEHTLPLTRESMAGYCALHSEVIELADAYRIPRAKPYSFNFLGQIPWTSGLRSIPEIARSHHEKLNGKGYPFGLVSEQIPVQAKMMTICDIFDALSASDRPYKRAVPTDRALDILKLCERDGEIDSELFRVFLEAQIYGLTAKAL